MSSALLPLPAAVPAVPPLSHAHATVAAKACEKTRSMAASGSATAAAPRLVDKKDARSEMWKYLSYISDSEGKPTDTTRPVCKTCFRSLQTKGANTSNLAKHLADRHPELFKDRQVSECDR